MGSILQAADRSVHLLVSGISFQVPGLTPFLLMNELGKTLLLLGGVLIVLGLLLIAGGRLHLPIGHLPGDIVYRGKNTTVYFPIVTSIVLSVVLSLIVYLMGRFSR